MMDDEGSVMDMENVSTKVRNEDTQLFGRREGTHDVVDENLKYKWKIDFHDIVGELSENITADIVGRGGYGIVYMAKWKGRTVCVKTLMLSRSYRRSFRHELRALCELSSHENIVELFGFISFPNKSTLGIVMEFAERNSLWSQLHEVDDQHIFTLEEKKNLCMQICSVLRFCHEEKRIAHRDLKTANILLFDDFKKAKLCDFGLSSFKEGTISTHSRVSKAGTEAYLAPEVRNGEVSVKEFEKWCRADIYSLAMITAEFLAEKEPSEQNFYMDPVGFVEEAVACSGLYEVGDFLLDCLTCSPEERPTAREFEEKLKELWK